MEFFCERCAICAIEANLHADRMADLGGFAVTVTILREDAGDWEQLAFTHDTWEHDKWAGSLAGMLLVGWPG